MHLAAHLILLLLSEFDDKLVRLKTNKSDLADIKWLTGLKPCLSNASKVLSLFKQTKFAAVNSPQTCLSRSKLQQASNLQARLLESVLPYTREEFSPALDTILLNLFFTLSKLNLPQA